MKAFTTLTIVSLIVLVGVILNSCQKEDSLPSKIEKAKSQLALPYENCETQCIIPGSDDYFYKDAEKIVMWGGVNDDKFIKTVNLRVYNTEDRFVFEFMSSHAPQNFYVDSVLVFSTPPGSEGQLFSYSIPLPEGWKACDSVKYSVLIDGQGPPAEFDVSYHLIGICSSCDESFSYVDNGDSTYTFTYIPDVDMDHAFIKFTFPQAVIIEQPEGWSQPGNGHVRQFETDLNACEPFVFTFKLYHKEPGKGPLWTSFNVNGEKKN